MDAHSGNGGPVVFDFDGEGGFGLMGSDGYYRLVILQIFLQLDILSYSSPSKLKLPT